MILADFARSLDLDADMFHALPGDRYALGADPVRGWIYLVDLRYPGADKPVIIEQLDAQDTESMLRLLDRARCIVESGVGDMK